MDIISLLLFVAVIAIGFIRKNNVGVIAIAVGAIAVRVFGLTDKDLIAGISTSLFTTLVGMTLLFGIITSTGALDLFARKVIALAGKRVWLLPILMFLAGLIVSGSGPGGIPALAIIPPMAVAIALQVGYDPIMLTLIGVNGMTAGRFSPFTPESAVIMGSVADSGLGNVTPAIFLMITITMMLISAIYFVIYKGYQLKEPLNTIDGSTLEKFNSKQTIALLAIVMMLVLIIFVGVNIGIAGFVVAAVLLMLHVAEDAACIKAMPWGTIVMVLGVGALLSIVNKMGGIDLMNDALSSIMTRATAIPIMGVSAGLLSLVSSALGVVYPTMMPMSLSIAEQVGNVNPVALMAAVAAGGSISGVSPMSTGGALILAALAGAKKGFTKEEESKAFMQLLIAAAASLLALVVISAVLYGFIANVMCPQV